MQDPMKTINILMLIMRIHYSIFAPVSSAHVEEIILSLRNKPDNINTFSTCVLKRIRHHVSHVLCHIINLSLRTDIFSDCLKLAQVTPIPTIDQYRCYRSLVKY